MMKLKFWGTRGSLPVALPLEQLRGKLTDMLMASGGRQFADRVQALAFIEQKLPFELGGGFGGNTSCVEVRTLLTSICCATQGPVCGYSATTCSAPAPADPARITC